MYFPNFCILLVCCIWGGQRANSCDLGAVWATVFAVWRGRNTCSSRYSSKLRRLDGFAQEYKNIIIKYNKYQCCRRPWLIKTMQIAVISDVGYVGFKI